MRVVLKDLLYDGKHYKEVSFDYPNYDFYNLDYSDLEERIYDIINDNDVPSDNSIVIEK